MSATGTAVLNVGGFRRGSTVSENATITAFESAMRYISFFLDIPETDVFKHLIFTNLVKCSTVGEQDILRPETMTQCFQLHFVREIEQFKPRVLIAFGREVERFLLAARAKRLHHLPVVYVKHPSYYYRKQEESKILSGIKSEVRAHLHPACCAQ